MIIIVFVFWGIGPQLNPSNVIVAQAGNERIPFAEYKRAYDVAYRRIREIYQDEEKIKEIDLKKMVLNELIDNMVLMAATKNAGITITREELQEAIINEPAFQIDGVFDREVYMRRLKLNRITPQMYENALKNELLLNKMRRLIGETAVLTEEEIKILNLIEGDKDQLSRTLSFTKRELAIKAYIEGLKRQMKITINKEFAS
jgi:peptidyl-prolyl cis-trans isomerase D